MSELFELKEVKAPISQGTLLSLLISTLENPITGPVAVSTMLKQLNIEVFRQLEAKTPIFRHSDFEFWSKRNEALFLKLSEVQIKEPQNSPFVTSFDYVRAYKKGLITPVEVAERLLSILQNEAKEINAFINVDQKDIMSQAEASTKRYKEGRPIGPLDGVPIAVKDEIDQYPYPTTQGTSFLNRPVKQDAYVVKRLRAAGALLIGKTNMHEIGIGVTGVNPNHGPARNPYDTSRITGGSSSGSAAAVAAGLCPIAIGADGGGSIRIPSGFCGVVGLKPTYGRVSERGAAPLTPTMGHIGPIGASVEDVAIAYAAIAGADPEDPISLTQPQPALKTFLAGTQPKLKIGIDQKWIGAASPQVRDSFENVMKLLQENGAELSDISMPMPGLAHLIHLITIATEMAAAHVSYYEHHKKDYGLDTRLSLILGRALQGYDYVHAQRLRTLWITKFFELFDHVDVIATPTIRITAPKIPEGALKTGQSNLPLTTKIMWFAPEANLSGVPAITIPSGYDSAGMPIGVQFMARPWSEDLLLALSMYVQKHIDRQTPSNYYPPLKLN